MTVRSRKKLAILVTSAQHTQSVCQLIESAQAKDVLVWVCLIGPAVRTVPEKTLEALADLARLAICRDTDENRMLPEYFSALKYRKLMISSKQMVAHLTQCDRSVVF